MITGNGTLLLRSGRTLAVGYQFSSDADDRRAGYLLCDLVGEDPAIMWEALQLVCEDGAIIGLAVTHASDNHLGVTGRLLQEDAA